MSQYAPHLLLHTDHRPSQAGMLLRNAGYVVSMVGDDDPTDLNVDDPDVDGLVVDVRALGAIAVVRKITARSRPGVVVLVITHAPDAMRLALPSIRVIKSSDVGDDLISTIDLALASHQP